jgi:hypothetical protein
MAARSGDLFGDGLLVATLRSIREFGSVPNFFRVHAPTCDNIIMAKSVCVWHGCGRGCGSFSCSCVGEADSLVKLNQF